MNTDSSGIKEDFTTTYKPLPDLQFVSHYMREAGEAFLFATSAIDRFSPVVIKMQRVVDSFNWRNFPNEQNQIIGLA